MRPLLVLRWSARDLRRRWLQVAAIALVIAVGTGVFSALGSTATWRRTSNDASFALLGMYDLRVRAAEGVDAATGAMAARLQQLPDPGVVDRAEERLVVPTQVDASSGEEAVLVPGRLVGLEVAQGGPQLNRVWVEDGFGRGLGPADAGAATVVLERNFATAHDLPASGPLRVGGTDVTSVGHGLSPEHFFVVTEEGGLFAQAGFAVVYTSLETAQQLAGRPGRVNDLLLRLRPGADPAAVAAEVRAAFDGTGLGVTVMAPRDEDAYRVLYDDIEGDQAFWNIFAALVLAGAAFGAFNLAARMVEAQRRELGIGMALGIPRRTLVLRPLLVGVEIAVLGVAFGVVMGLAVQAAIRPVYTEVLPLPVWDTSFQLATFARGAVLGFVLPVLATAWPVWRAVRVTPVDAITTSHRGGRRGLARVLRHLPWPRRADRRMPLGNVLRAPRRTVLTALGIAAALTALVTTLGMVDSFLATLDANDREALQGHPDRVVVTLDGPHEPGGAELAAITGQPAVGAVQPVLRFAGQLASAGEEGPIDVLVEATDLAGPVWHPTTAAGALPVDGEGLVISEEAAADLGVGAGSTVVLHHPTGGGGGLELTTTELVVAGVHPGALRFATYLAPAQLAALGLPEAVNELYVLPAAGSTPSDVQRALFGLPGVASAQPVEAGGAVVRDALDQFIGVFRVLELFVLLLALLIAYNASSINAEERRREHATLFAFGQPVRRVLAMDTVEALLVGLLGTAVGLVAGTVVLRWVTSALVGTTMPELGIHPAISNRTLLTAVVLGVGAVAVAPLLTVRRLWRMDIPDTLRVVE